MKVRVTMGAAVAGMLLAACGGLRSETVDRLYVLRPAAAQAGAPAVAGVLSIQRPAVQPGLDTDRIALTRDGNELDFFAASRWGAALPQVVSALAVESLAGSGGFGTVLDAGRAAVPGDFELLLTVRHFEAVYESALAEPVARVTFECVVTAGTPRRVLGRCDADVSEPATENRMAPIVAALEKAAQRALAEVRGDALAAAATVRR